MIISGNALAVFNAIATLTGLSIILKCMNILRTQGSELGYRAICIIMMYPFVQGYSPCNIMVLTKIVFLKGGPSIGGIY